MDVEQSMSWQAGVELSGNGSEWGIGRLYGRVFVVVVVVDGEGVGEDDSVAVAMAIDRW